MSTSGDRGYPLSGVTVLDLGQIYNGSYATFLMAMAGADVIKVEPPRGEYLRARSAVAGAAMPFAMLNSNKKSVILDLKQEEGKTLFKRMVAKADIVLENFAPGIMDRLGVGWDVLSAINPRLIYASGSGFGLSGPYRDYPAMDLTVQAMAGLMSVTGYPDQPPVKCGPALCDYAGGTHLYAATMTALYERERTGRGRLVEVSMQESVYMTISSNLALWYASGGSIPMRTGNRHGGLATAPYNVYPSTDGYVAIICVNDRHWRSLTEVMGRPELAEDARYATLKNRVERMDEVDEIVATWTRVRPKEEAFQALIANRVPAAPVRDIAEVVADPHLHERGMIRWVDHPEFGRIVLPNSPLRFHGSPMMALEPSPKLGEDGDAFYRDFLELSEEEMTALKEKQVI
jgi:crotonobetainyl-CoA:carnitine CoA-transferase CaiB-like acyl-CoA transferase